MQPTVGGHDPPFPYGFTLSISYADGKEVPHYTRSVLDPPNFFRPYVLPPL